MIKNFAEILCDTKMTDDILAILYFTLIGDILSPVLLLEAILSVIENYIFHFIWTLLTRGEGNSFETSHVAAAYTLASHSTVC